MLGKKGKVECREIARISIEWSEGHLGIENIKEANGLWTFRYSLQKVYSPTLPIPSPGLKLGLHVLAHKKIAIWVELVWVWNWIRDWMLKINWYLGLLMGLACPICIESVGIHCKVESSKFGHKKRLSWSTWWTWTWLNLDTLSVLNPWAFIVK